MHLYGKTENSPSLMKLRKLQSVINLLQIDLRNLRPKTALHGAPNLKVT